MHIMHFKLTCNLTFMQNDYYVRVALMNVFYYVQEELSVRLVSRVWKADISFRDFKRSELTTEQLKSICFIAMEISLAAY